MVERIDAHPAFMPAGGITHARLVLGLAAVDAFYEANGDNKTAERIIPEVELVRDAVKDIPGFQGCFGLGYPFYALSENCPSEVLPVPSISEFLGKSRSMIHESSRQHGAPWPCVDCQATNGLPDLKTLCRPCKQTKFKPRDLFESLPDIDIVMVIDNSTAATERLVQSRLGELGLIQSDIDIRGAYNRTLAALMGANDQAKFPVDAHIWSLNTFAQAAQQLQANPARGNVPITSRSLHAQWEDHTINFWFDFVFSLTEVGELEPQLKGIVDKTRMLLVKQLGADAILDIISDVSKRGRAILADPKLLAVMRSKLEKWQSYNHET